MTFPLYWPKQMPMGTFLEKARKARAKLQERNWEMTVATAAPGDSHIQAEDEHRIQDNVADRSDEHRGHTDDREALTVDEVVEPDGHEGKKGADGIDRKVGIRVGEGLVTGAEPAEQLSFYHKKQHREDCGKKRQ